MTITEHSGWVMYSFLVLFGVSMLAFGIWLAKQEAEEKMCPVYQYPDGSVEYQVCAKS